MHRAQQVDLLLHEVLIEATQQYLSGQEVNVVTGLTPCKNGLKVGPYWDCQLEIVPVAFCL